MIVADLIEFESAMKEKRGMNRGQLCRELGISQAKWRRHLEGRLGIEPVQDRTLALAMAAVDANMLPWPSPRDGHET